MEYQFSIDFGSGYVVVAQPLNHSAIKIDVDFTSGSPSASVSSIAFEWVGDTAEKINTYVQQGLSGGRGIYEGLGLRIDACNQSIGFDLVLDLAHSETRIECDRVSCPIIEAGRIDWMNDIAGSFTFWYLATALTDGGAGIITASDYKATPYVISEIPQYTQVITLSISTLLIIWQTIQLVHDITDLIEKIVGDISDLTTQLGTNIGTLIVDILILVGTVAYTYLVVKALIQLIQEIVDNIIQRKKYKLCMRIDDLFRKGCQYLNLNFSSSIFSPSSIYYDATWMPQKIVQPNLNYQAFSLSFDRPEDELSGIGNPYGYYDGTFKDFIEDMKTLFNADIRIDNGTMYFEEKHFWNLYNPYIVDNTDEIGYTYNANDPHGTNATECPSVYNLQFQLDDSEMNTIHRYQGTTASVQVLPNVIGNKKHLTSQTGVVITFPCALGKRKEYLNDVEIKLQKLINFTHDLVSVVDFIVEVAINSLLGLPGAVASIIAGHPIIQINNLADSIPIDTFSQRIGWLELSNDSFSIPKIFVGTQVGNDWEVHPNSYERMSAQGLLYWFHGKNLATRGNQYLTYFDKVFKFCCADFVQVLQSNVMMVPTTSGGHVFGKFTRIVWDLESEMATADYRINQLFTTNLTERLIVDGLNAGVIGQGGSSGGNGSGGGGGGTQWPQ
ncbi:hypothetical protein UFOVP518_24 [uncultured Caudovirales phage]|uniref:Uncharacterized protein n=1 Tax=uncultured Caudovirales phage TaxID=2100421 RepID=A0A6J5MM30_9CAUD|nr:hypothetical protein UFOVP518_24 [uncultured Caudovirales phage]